MPIQLPIRRLTTFESSQLFKRGEYAPEVWTIPLQIEGNSLLSSVYVRSMDPGASILCRYYQTTLGQIGEERSPIIEHQLISPGMVDPLYGLTNIVTVTPIHNKPVLEVTLSGGSADFGVYGTVVQSFALDLGNAAKLDGQEAVLDRDRGFPFMLLDPISGEFRFVRSQDGGLPVVLQGSASVTLETLASPLIRALPLTASAPTLLSFPVGTREWTIKSRSGRPFRLATTEPALDDDFSLLSLYRIGSLSPTTAHSVYLMSEASGEIIEAISWS
jgi:hypothetical protein